VVFFFALLPRNSPRLSGLFYELNVNFSSIFFPEKHPYDILNKNQRRSPPMATKNVAMYSKKQYELEQIKDGIIAYFEQHKKEVADFRQAIRRELGEAKTMLLIFETYSIGRQECVSLIIQLSELQHFQSADIFGTGGARVFGVSAYSEDTLVDFGIEALKSLGFEGKNV
jgi:hypothetical protein